MRYFDEVMAAVMVVLAFSAALLAVSLAIYIVRGC